MRGTKCKKACKDEEIIIIKKRPRREHAEKKTEGWGQEGAQKR